MVHINSNHSLSACHECNLTEKLTQVKFCEQYYRVWFSIHQVAATLSGLDSHFDQIAYGNNVFTWGQFWPLFTYVCICVRLCPCVRQSRAWPFKLGSLNLDQRCKIHCFVGQGDESWNLNWPHFELESPNLEQWCKTPWLRSLLFLFSTKMSCAVFLIKFSETALVNVSSIITAGDRIGLHFWLNVSFYHKSSMNISIDNRYCNSLIHIGRPI